MKTAKGNSRWSLGPTTWRGGSLAKVVGWLAQWEGRLAHFRAHSLFAASYAFLRSAPLVLSQFIQQWSRELMWIDDMAMPCPLLHLPYIRSPLPPLGGHHPIESHLSFRSRYTTREKSHKQAHEELDSTRVQAVERTLIGWYFLQTLPSHSISLFLIQD